MRVLHLPTSVGSNAWNLSLAERSLGITSRVMVKGVSIYGSTADIIKQWNNRFSYPYHVLRFYREVMDDYDIFHFNFGSSLLNYRYPVIGGADLWWLKRRGKKIVVTYQGSDARQADYCLDNHSISYFTAEDRYTERKLDLIKAQRIERFDRYADIIYATNPDLLGVLPSRAVFRPYTKLQVEDWVPNYSDYERDHITIAHAPTDRRKKGTSLIVDAVRALVDEGYPISLELVEGVPNATAVEMYKKADLVVDQLYIGWYGGFSVECMALGKPVMVYIRDADLKYVPKEMARDLPFIRTSPGSFYDDLKSVVNNRALLRERARKSREFAEKWHDSKKIAKRIIDDYYRIL